MNQLERQIHAAQRRLHLNQWLHDVTLLLALASCAFAVVVLVQRLWDLPIPLKWVAMGLVLFSLLGSMLWSFVRRLPPAAAAAALDGAAGLRERISSGWYCRASDDPFARAVVADAERVSRSVTVRSFLRLQTPRSLPFTCASMAAAMLMFLISPGLLKSPETVKAAEQSVEAQQTHEAVKKQMESIQKFAEATPAAQEFAEQLKNLDPLAGGELRKPDDIRHEAIKKIDRLEDALKQKRSDDKYESVPQLRKMLRGLKVPPESEGLPQKLSQSLKEGDFKAAQEEIAAIKEQLATLKSQKDQELAEKLGQQLDDLAKQLEKLAADEKLAQKLEQAGIDKKDVERMLERLGKQDLDQLKKSLEQKGFSQQQIEQLAKQLQSRKQAGALAKKLADSMKQASSCKNPGQMGESMAGLSQAADQLSEMEMLESEMSELEGAMASLDQAKQNIDKPCPG